MSFYSECMQRHLKGKTFKGRADRQDAFIEAARECAKEAKLPEIQEKFKTELEKRGICMEIALEEVKELIDYERGGTAEQDMKKFPQMRTLEEAMDSVMMDYCLCKSKAGDS